MLSITLVLLLLWHAKMLITSSGIAHNQLQVSEISAALLSLNSIILIHLTLIYLNSSIKWDKWNIEGNSQATICNVTVKILSWRNGSILECKTVSTAIKWSYFKSSASKVSSRSLGPLQVLSLLKVNQLQGRVCMLTGIDQALRDHWNIQTVTVFKPSLITLHVNWANKALPVQWNDVWHISPFYTIECIRTFFPFLTYRCCWEMNDRLLLMLL